MSRSGYSEDYGNEWDLIRWRGAVTSSIRGKRGQAFLKELLQALDAMPQKRLIAGEFVTTEGEVCALGVVASARGVDLSDVDPEDAVNCHDVIARRLAIAPALVAETIYTNDDYYRRLDPEERFKIVRQWVMENIKT